MVLLWMSTITMIACTDFLDERSDKRLAVPATLEDFQALMNELHAVQLSPADGEVAADNLYLPDDRFTALNCEYEWDLYLWKDGPMTRLCYGNDGWRSAYKSIYNVNAVLEGLTLYQGSMDSRYDDILGQAHFYRGITYLELAVIWTEAYDQNTAESRLGLPLRLSADFNEVSVRSDLKTTFDQIIRDLQSASYYLPEVVSNKMRPSKSAAWGALARAFLLKGDFARAVVYADSCLVGKQLIDYNTIPTEIDHPFDRLDNNEIVFERYLYGYMSLYPGIYARVDTALYQSYQEDDIRKRAFFRRENDGFYSFKGSYGGANLVNFSGIAVDEVYLILAESLYRSGHQERASDILEYFVRNRYEGGYRYAKEDTLEGILSERRKQLLFRGLRYGDIKRLNLMGGNISLERVVGGERYTLTAHDPRFSILIPLDVIQLSGMEQNRR